MDLLSGVVMIFTYLTTHHQIQTHTQTLATITGPRVGTAIAAPLHEHSWQEVITSNRMKWKLSTKQLKKYKLAMGYRPQLTVFKYHKYELACFYNERS